MAKLEESPATIEQIETLKQLIEQWRALKTYEIKKQVAILSTIQTPMEILSAPVVNEISSKAEQILEQAEGSNEQN
tara:strand:+ start:155 stop:382 length:228 start_codon:yes stop_codon:yes gene_type:complete